jgi:hypothetical protein
MTPRPLARTRRAFGLALAAGSLLMLSGCDPRALIYFLQPFEPMIPHEGPSLKGKRVVVLAHAAKGTQNDFLSIDRDLTREFIKILREKTKRLDVVDTDKVWAWMEAHPSWSDPSEAARAFEADMSIFLEIERFQISSPTEPQLFKGVSQIHIMVHELKYPKNDKGREMTDKPKEAEQIYDAVVNTEFPNRGPMEMGNGVSAGGFKNKFLKLVATEVSWHFVDHAPGDDIQDTKIGSYGQ